MKESVHFCPACGSPSITSSVLEGGEASCNACSWKGGNQELLALPIEHSFSSQEEMITRFVGQLATTLAKTSALEVGRILLQWGFLTEEKMQEELKVYLRVMAITATKAVIETRQHLERIRMQKVVKREHN